MQRTVGLLLLIFFSGIACTLGQAATNTPQPTTAIITASATTFITLPANTTNTASATTSSSSSGSSNSGASSAGFSGYVVDIPAPYPVCSVAPTGDFTVNIRRKPNASSTVIGILNKASWVKVSQFVNGWFQIDYPNTPVHQAWISGDPVTLTQPCDCLPTCAPRANPPSQPGVCLITAMQTVDVYDAPGNWARVVTKLNAGTSINADTASTNGWYRVNYGTADTPYSWVPSSYIQIQGNCDTLPKQSPNPPLLACTVTNNSGENQVLRSSPEVNDANYIGRFPSGDTMTVIRKQGDWYMVWVEAFSNSAWVAGNVMTPNGQCP